MPAGPPDERDEHPHADAVTEEWVFACWEPDGSTGLTNDIYATYGTDLRRPLRSGASADQLAQLIRATWEVRSDRGAEERLASRDRSPLIPVDRLKRELRLR